MHFILERSLRGRLDVTKHGNPAITKHNALHRERAPPARAVASVRSQRSDMPSTVHVLSEPPKDQKPTCDVVFFHGLQLGSYENAWDHTWRNEKEELWPAEWLPKDFPTARILSISYDSQAFGGKKTMEQIANILLHDMCMLARVGQDCPVVLVGHSLGGLVLKKLAVEAKREAGRQDQSSQGSAGSVLQPYCKAFCNNLAGTFFYATPHGGATLGSLAKAFGSSVWQKGPVLDYLEVFNRDAAVLSRQFSMDFPTIKLMALVETKKYKPTLLPGIQVVAEGSAITTMHDYVEVDEDHISICKPPSKDTNTYCYLKLYIQDALTKLQESQQLLVKTQQQVLPHTVQDKATLVNYKISLNKNFIKDAEPSMVWFRAKKRELEPELGERWPEGLYPAGQAEEDPEVKQHRQATRVFWDEVKELCNGGLLDDSFFDGIWAERGKDYRLLVEPVDIANYYHRGLQNGSKGHYIDGINQELSDNRKRPGRYILLQKQEQRWFSGNDPSYTAQSSLGLARLLKERVGNRSWDEYKQQPELPEEPDAPQEPDVSEQLEGAA